MSQNPNVPQALADALEKLPKELSKAAVFLIENPSEISLSSTREIASMAGVKPNTLVRLARAIGYDGFESMRESSRQEIRSRPFDFPGRAKALQEISKDGNLDNLYSEMGRDALDNVGQLYTSSESDTLRQVAVSLIKARRAYVLGIGVSTAFVHNFTYLADMAVDNISAIPQYGLLPIDGLAVANEKDSLIVMTFKPYRREIVDAVEYARSIGMTVTAVSDSLASPIMHEADYKLIAPTKTPQFFPSMVAVTALLETIVAYLVAEADESAVENIESFHRRRAERDVYWQQD